MCVNTTTAGYTKSTFIISMQLLEEKKGMKIEYILNIY